MDITIERIVELFENETKSNRAILLDMGFSTSAFTDWKRGQSKPTTEGLKKIAKYFNVSADYLLGLSDVQEPFNSENFNSTFYNKLNKKGIGINHLDALPDDKQMIIVNLADSLVKDFSLNKSKPKVQPTGNNKYVVRYVANSTDDQPITTVEMTEEEYQQFIQDSEDLPHNPKTE